MNFAPATWDGELQTLIGTMVHAMRARCASTMYWKTVGTMTLRYIYDFGDDREHTIKVERLIDPLPEVAYPGLIDAVGRCPPEDIGGPWGDLELLDARANPKHQRHVWREPSFSERPKGDS